MVKKLGYNVNVSEARNDGGYKTTIKNKSMTLKKKSTALYMRSSVSAISIIAPQCLGSSGMTVNC